MDPIADRSHPAFANVHPWAFEGLGHVSHAWRYVFLATPKVACSSILLTLQRLERADAMFVHQRPQDVHETAFSPLERMTQNVARLTDASYFKWCFVRNPYDRLLSCWLEKVHDGPLRPMFESMLGRPGRVSFAEFIRAIGIQPAREMEPHYAPQAFVTFSSIIPFDFIGRFERLDADLAHAFGRFGADYRAFAAVVDGHKTGAKPYHLITPELESLITKTFAIDFETYSYSMKPPTCQCNTAL